MPWHGGGVARGEKMTRISNQLKLPRSVPLDLSSTCTSTHRYQYSKPSYKGSKSSWRTNLVTRCSCYGGLSAPLIIPRAATAFNFCDFGLAIDNSANDSQELVVFHSPTHRLLPILQKDLAEL